MMRFGPKLSRIVEAIVGGILVLWGLGGIVPAHADGTDDTAVPRVFGETYGAWSGRWWQWVHSFPAASNPLVEAGTIDCSRGQREPVWFLAGTLGGEAVRTCTIQRGKALLFPLVNAEWINSPGDCGRDAGCTEAEKRQLLYDDVNLACNLASTLDGVPTVFSLITARTQSPTYRVEIGQDDIFGFPAGTVDEATVADGSWVLLPPLPAGNHVLHFRGALCDATTHEPFFTTEVTYNLTVHGDS